MKVMVLALLVLGRVSLAQENPLKVCMKGLLQPKQVLTDFFEGKSVAQDQAAQASEALAQNISRCTDLEPSVLLNIPEKQRAAFLKSYKFAIKKFAEDSVELRKRIESGELESARQKWESMLEFKELAHFATRYRSMRFFF